MDAHNEPGGKEVIAPAPFKGGMITKDILALDVPAKSVVVVQLD
jgi:alpha-L-arabinofuranosidase